MSWSEIVAFVQQPVVTSLLTSSGVAVVAKIVFEHRLKERLASQQGEIQRQVNAHKSELDQAVLSSKMLTDKLFLVLPELWEMVLLAEAHVDAMRGFNRQDWATLTPKEVTAAIAAKHPRVRQSHLDELERRFVAAPTNDAKNRLVHDMLDALFQELARRAIRDARNFLAKQEIFAPSEVLAHATDALDKLHKAHAIAADPNKQQGDAKAWRELKEDASKDILALKVATRRLLTPAEGTAPDPPPALGLWKRLFAR